MENIDIINKRIRNIKIIAVLCLLAIMGKFFIVTVYYQDGFSELAKYQSTVELKQTLPRGEIYDSEGKLLAGNKLSYDLSYIEPNIKDNKDLFADAKAITELIDIDSSGLTDQQIMDIWLSLNGGPKGELNSTIAYENMTDEQKLKYNELDDQKDAENPYRYLEMNELLYSTITDEQINDLIKEYGKDVLYVKAQMATATSKSPVKIKSDLSLEEVYKIENEIGKIGGFIITDNWQRTYPQGENLRSFLGSTGDIPAEDKTLYESQGYSLDEKVGTSYLEKQLESVLHSTPQTMECFFDDDGNLIRNEITNEGELGNDVQLTINIKFQKYVESILKKQLSDNNYRYDKNIFSVVSDPNTGDLLALAGMQDIDGEFYENSIGNFTNAYPIGSIVKPAVLLMGYDLGKWDWGTVIHDAPMRIKGTAQKASYHNYGDINEIEALTVSSNVYFYRLLLEIAGEKYVEGEALDISKEYFDLVRKEFEQFGLGTSTGIQIEGETLGVQGSDYQPGFYLDLANGQYDTYTPLQAAQYVSTLANGGTRFRTNYLKKITTAAGQGTMGKVIYEQPPVVLNQLSMSDKDIEHTKLGMVGCASATNGSGRNGGYDKLNTPGACKTGTSEDFVYDEETQTTYKVNNASFIGYAPRENPKFSIVTVLPAYTSDDFYDGRRNGAYYSKFIQDYYFKEIAND